MIYLSAFSDEAATSLQGQIDALKRNNIGYMEVRFINGVPVRDFTLEQAEEYTKIMNAQGIKVWSIGSPLGKEDIKTLDFNDYENTVRHICKIAKIMGTEKIRMFSFFKAYDEEEKVYAYLRRMVEIANEYGVTLYHENEKDIFGDNVERVLKIMQNVKGLKWVYDPANFLQVGERADNSLEKLHALTDYFHIKDVVFETGELVPAGHGDGKIDKLIAKIDKDTTMTLEPHLRIFDAFKSIDDTEMKHKFHFTSNGEAFDAAVSALKNLLVNAGYKEVEGGFTK
jgi:sugar phosphate isomerase/epimerase